MSNIDLGALTRMNPIRVFAVVPTTLYELFPLIWDKYSIQFTSKDVRDQEILYPDGYDSTKDDEYIPVHIRAKRYSRNFSGSGVIYVKPRYDDDTIIERLNDISLGPLEFKLPSKDK